MKLIKTPFKIWGFQTAVFIHLLSSSCLRRRGCLYSWEDKQTNKKLCLI